MLNTYDNFTLNSYFGHKPLSRKTCTSMSTTYSLFHHIVVDIEVHVFLVMASGRNIELRVKL